MVAEYDTDELALPKPVYHLPDDHALLQPTHIKHNVSASAEQQEYSDERKALHNSIIGKRLDPVTEPESKVLVLTVGAPAQGKSYTLEYMLPLMADCGILERQQNIENAAPNIFNLDLDQMIEGLPEYDTLSSPEKLAASCGDHSLANKIVESGMGDTRARGVVHSESYALYHKAVEAAFDKQVSIAMHTTGKDLEYTLPTIYEARKKGYEVVVIQTTLSPEETLNREAQRRSTGRITPVEFLAPNISNSVRHGDFIMAEADLGLLCDTSEQKPQVIALYKNGEQRILDIDKFTAHRENILANPLPQSRDDLFIEPGELYQDETREEPHITRNSAGWRRAETQSAISEEAFEKLVQDFSDKESWLARLAEEHQQSSRVKGES